MNEAQCGTIGEFIPDLTGNRLLPDEIASVEAHLVGCGECRAELELAQTIFSSRAVAPDALEGRIIAAVRRDGRTSHRPWWGLSAAAVAALALGIGIASEPSASSDFDVPEFASEVGAGDLWLSDDGLVAGAPSLDGLSVEALMELLDELSLGSAGGSA
jgi:hypothetical protein